MARAWFYNIPLTGHINPTLPLIRELVRRGDEITYFSSRAYEDRILSTGAFYRGYANQDAIEQSRNVTHLIHQASQVARATYALLPEVLSAVEQERPDYLLFDMSAPWGGIASRQFDIPAVASFPHLPFYWRTLLMDWRILWKISQNIRPGYGYWRDLQHLTSKIRREYKLRDPKDINVLSSTAELNIVFSSRYFQPFEKHFVNSYVYIGPDVRLDRQEEPMQISKREGQKLIFIAVGTVYKASLDFFRCCMAAFADDCYTVIMSIGKALDPSSLGAIPKNFIVAQFVPQLAVLRKADVFITHGGMSSISEAVLNRVPMVVVPNTTEQSINAAILEKLGAGLYLEHSQVTVDALQNAIQKVISDPKLKKGIERIRNSFLKAGGDKRGAAEIQVFKDRYGLT
jgi:MGT family glycosyltransferase